MIVRTASLTFAWLRSSLVPTMLFSATDKVLNNEKSSAAGSMKEGFRQNPDYRGKDGLVLGLLED